MPPLYSLVPLSAASVRSNRSRRAQVEQPAEHAQVLPAGEDLVDGGELAGEADAPAHLARVAGDVEAGHLGAAAVEADERGQDAHGGGLAGAVGAEQAVDRALRYGQVEPVEGVFLAVSLLQPNGCDRVAGGAQGSPFR